MPKHNRILVPVDLSQNSFAAIDLATTMAQKHNAKLAFVYVTALWNPEETKHKAALINQLIEKEKTKLYRLRPSGTDVDFEHCYLFGNAGPTIVKECESADMVVMSTHGRSGISRLLVGSVANYVLRHAECQVLLAKGVERATDIDSSDADGDEFQSFVTEVMHPVAPIHAYETMDSVLAELNKANETAAPVVDGMGICIGILTTTDIEKFNALKKRFEEKDESVISEMFEVDEYGQRRAPNYNFDQVERHMTRSVVSIRNTQSIFDAVKLFESNPEIHHLVVLDDRGRPVGVVDSSNIGVNQNHPMPSNVD